MIVLDTDILIIGAGGAGLRAALEAGRAGARVLMTSKGPIGRSGTTTCAHFSIMAPMRRDPRDSAACFFQDVVDVGAGLADENLVSLLVNNVCDRVKDLDEIGVGFLKSKDNQFKIFSVPGSSYPRSVGTESVGKRILSALSRRVKNLGNVETLEDVFIVSLGLSNDRVTGAQGFMLLQGEQIEIRAGSVILATGGDEALWESCSCPPGSVGDGQYLALHAGAELVDMEMVQFYPSLVIWPEGLKGALIPYELLAPEFIAGQMTDGNGISIFPQGLPVRDEASRRSTLLLREAKQSPHGGLFWDITHSPKPREELEAIFSQVAPVTLDYLRKAGSLDPLAERVEVKPGAHYLIGGVRINERAETNLPGLYAIPTCAGNVEGANRLSGIGLACTQVFSVIAAREALDSLTTTKGPMVFGRLTEDQLEKNRPRAHEVKAEIRRIMDHSVGPARSGSSLSSAFSHLEQLRNDEVRTLRQAPKMAYDLETIDGLEARIMADLAIATVKAALIREESRGNHFREDFPERDDKRFMAHTITSMKGGELSSAWAPVIKTRFTG